jgi:hypothetical protein
MKQNWRDLVGGICLVPVLHLLVPALTWGLQTLIESLSIAFPGIHIRIRVDVGLAYIGLAQFIYLIPVMLVFRIKQRFEVVKGISIGAIVTILLNGAFFGFLFATLNLPKFAVGAAIITILLMLIVFHLFNHRSRPK